MSIYKLLFFVLLFSGCKTTAVRKLAVSIIEYPQKLTITGIYCLNLAEKIIGIGTKNDEILLLIFEENAQNEINFLASTDFLTFEKEDSIGQLINIFIPVNADLVSEKLKFLLIELDTERTKEQLIQLAQKLLPQNLPPNILKEKLREDDLLGIETLSTIKVSKSGRLIFSGMHLFDKYHYEVSYKFK